MGPAERHQGPVSGRTMSLVVTVLVIAAVSSAVNISGDSALPTMNAHLAECYDTLLRSADRLCAETTDQRNKVLTSALSKCLFGRVGLGKTEQCHQDTSLALKLGDVTDGQGSASPECRQVKTYKSSSVYGTVLTSLLSACALKQYTQQMFEVSVANAIANRSDSILPAKDLVELLRLAQRVDAVYSLVLEHSSWINMIFYYSGLASLLAIITKHPSSQHYRWQLFGIILLTVIAEKFLCYIVLCVVDVYSSQMVLNLMRWTVRYTGLATTAIFFIRNFSSNLGFTRSSDTTLVPSARQQGNTDLVLAGTEQWDRGRANNSTTNFVVGNSATEDGASNSATDDGAANSAPEDGATNSAPENGALNSATENGATNSATEDGATNSATEDGAPNSASEDDGATLSEGSLFSPLPELPKQSEAYLSLSALLFNRSLPDISDEDDVDYESPNETSEAGSSEDADDIKNIISQEELDILISDQRDSQNETVTAETMSLSYTGGIYFKGDRTFRE